MKITPKFTPATIEKLLQNRLNIIDRAIVNRLSNIGESFIIEARSKTAEQGSFRDHTGNLRSSIGYVVLKNGVQLVGAFPGNKPEGVTKGKQIASEAADKYNRGYVLIVVAGMEYAASVESKNKDVITGSSLTIETDLRAAIRDLNSKIGR